jgi:hypothetical protein
MAATYNRRQEVGGERLQMRSAAACSSSGVTDAARVGEADLGHLRRREDVQVGWGIS